MSDLWPTVKGLFEEHQPLKRAFLTNKTRNPVFIENLPVEFILTTDARLRSRFPQEQYLYWFREPYATIVLVTCEVLVLLISFFFGFLCHPWQWRVVTYKKKYNKDYVLDDISFLSSFAIKDKNLGLR